MYTTQQRQLDTLTLVPGNVARQKCRLQNGTQSQFLDIRVTGTLTISAGGGTAVVNRGSILSAIQAIGITENGRDRVLCDGPSLRQLAEYAPLSPISAVRLGAVAAAAYPLAESFRLWFAHPYAQNPRETAFLERDPYAALEFFVQLFPAPGPQVVTAGAGAGTFGNITVSIFQTHDMAAAKRPYFIPSIRQITESVPAANPQLPLYLRLTNYVRGILIKQEAQNAAGSTIEVNTLINSLSLSGDARMIMGPEFVLWPDFVASMEEEFGGNVGTGALQSNLAYAYLNFQKDGKLDRVLNPLQDTNLRFKFNAAPSGGGNTGDLIRLTIVELEHDKSMLDVNGRPLTDDIPFAV